MIITSNWPKPLIPTPCPPISESTSSGANGPYASFELKFTRNEGLNFLNTIQSGISDAGFYTSFLPSYGRGQIARIVGYFQGLNLGNIETDYINSNSPGLKVTYSEYPNYQTGMVTHLLVFTDACENFLGSFSF